MTTPILLDTDIGTDVDDALALGLAIRSPEVDLRRVTTVGSRTEFRATIARTLLELAGRSDVPVIAGRGRPLPSERFSVWLPDGLWLGHEGEGLLPDAELADQGDVADHDDAVRAIVDAVLDGEATTIVTIGPLTNLASAFQAKPEIVQRVARVIAMGGCVLDDAVPPLAEFNCNADREAAAIVLASGVPVTLMPIEMTLRTYFTEADVALLHAGEPLAAALASLIDVWTPIFRRLREVSGTGEADTPLVCNLHDPAALLTLIRPELLSFREVRIDLEENDDGALTTRAAPDGAIPLVVVDDIDASGCRSFVAERLLGEP
jgi:purine nucleosidase